MLGPNLEQRRTLQIGIGTAAKWSIHHAELMAIWYATKMIQELETQVRLPSILKLLQPPTTKLRYTPLSVQSALNAIVKSAAKSGQSIVQRILDQVQTLEEGHIRVRLFWVPGHANNEGNEAADHLAKQAVSASEDHDFRTLLSTHTAKNPIKGSRRNGGTNGQRQDMDGTSRILTLSYLTSGPCDYMDPSQGMRHNSSPSCGAITPGCLPMERGASSSTTTTARVVRWRQWHICWWTAHYSGYSGGNYGRR